MKTRMPHVLGLVFVAAIFAAVVSAQAPKGLAGTWKLDVAKSKFSPGPAPKSMTITYTPGPGDTMKIVVDVTPGDGTAAQHWEMSGGYDGKDNPVTGNPNADTISMKRVDDMHGESTFKKAGKVSATNMRTLSADGKTLTIVSKGTTADGKPRMDTQVFTK
jgi:hypothetical protein